MKRVFVCLLMTFSTFSFLASQDKVTILTVDGKVNYFSGSGNLGKRIRSGDELAPRGFIRCEEGALAVLLFKGERKKITSGEELNLTDLLSNKSKTQRGGYIGRFLNFIGTSVNNTEDNDQLEKYHQRYMGNAKGGIKGYGKDGAEVLTFDYHEGPMGKEELNLEWSSELGAENNSIYSVEIYEEESQTLFFKAHPRRNSLSLDLGQYRFEEGKLYAWQVIATGSDEQVLKSKKRLFSYEPGLLAEFLAQTDLQKAQSKLEEGERALLLLYSLEQEGFAHSALVRYEQLLAAEPDNNLYKRLYASFLVRMGNLEKAKTIFETIK